MTSISISKISPFLLHRFVSEHDLVKAIHELSAGFTNDRKLLENYLNDERLISAYTAFYLLTNYPKLEEALKWLPATWVEEVRQSSFIDLGAGPGTFSIAWKIWQGRTTPGIAQIETSALMRKQADKIWKGLFSEEQLLNFKDIKSNKLLFFGHSANEMGVDKSLRYIKEIGPENILFVEPGTKDFFSVMLQIRKALLEMGYHIIFPCPNSLACPMEESKQDWCHQFMHIKQESEVERISQMARKDRRNLPIIVQAFSKTYQNENPILRVVRVLPETKFSYEWEVCEENQLQSYQVMKRGLDRATTDQLSGVLAGAAIEAELEKQLPDSKRVKIIKIN